MENDEYLLEIYSCKSTISQKTYDFLLEKYKHEIKIQQEMIGNIRKETFKPDHLFDPEKLKYLQKIYEEYINNLWFLFNFEAEHIEMRNKK